MLINWLYYFFAILLVLGTLSLLFTSYILYVILNLIFVVICLSALYFLQGAPFVAIIQLILHAGGVLVLLVCTLLFSKPVLEIPPPKKRNKYTYKIIVLVGITLCLVLFIVYHLSPLAQKLILPSSSRLTGTVQELGYQILGPYGLLLELISILLLIVLVGALHVIMPKDLEPKVK